MISLPNFKGTETGTSIDGNTVAPLTMATSTPDLVFPDSMVTAGTTSLNTPTTTEASTEGINFAFGFVGQFFTNFHEKSKGLLLPERYQLLLALPLQLPRPLNL